MIFRFFFSKLSTEKQIQFFRKRGQLIGTRMKDGRRIFIYMYRDMFAEIVFRNDNPDEPHERMILVKGLNNLNEYLEKEFRANF